LQPRTLALPAQQQGLENQKQSVLEETQQTGNGHVSHNPFCSHFHLCKVDHVAKAGVGCNKLRSHDGHPAHTKSQTEAGDNTRQRTGNNNVLDDIHGIGTHTADGVVKIQLDVEEACYYEMLTEMVGETIADEYQLIGMLKNFAAMKHEYTKVLDAVNLVRMKGYGVVTPDKEEIVLEKPELIKHGNKFGVKIKASSPSIHMIRANIETEIAPIVGTQEQAEDLIRYINRTDCNEDIWDTNIFGKTVEQLVNDGITAKVAVIGEESQLKLQDTMQKIVNDSNGGLVCIII